MRRSFRLTMQCGRKAISILFRIASSIGCMGRDSFDCGFLFCVCGNQVPEVKHDRVRKYPSSTERCRGAPPHWIRGAAVVDFRQRRNHWPIPGIAGGPGAMAVHRHLLGSDDFLQLRVVARGQAALAGMNFHSARGASEFDSAQESAGWCGRKNRGTIVGLRTDPDSHALRVSGTDHPPDAAGRIVGANPLAALKTKFAR
jgi:hypothetical protein